LKVRFAPYVLIFVAFAIFRGVAEILAGEIPVGWDSINYYAPWTITYAQHGVLNQIFLAAPPFVFIFTIPLYLLTSNIWLVMKVLAPVLYGVVGVSVFFFSRSYLSWSIKKSSFCAMLLMFQLAAMRIGWDLFKNEQRKIMDQILEKTLESIETHFRQIYDYYYPLMQIRSSL